MIYIGFFRELQPSGPEVYQGSIHDAIAQGGDYPVATVIEYLQTGHPILDVMEMTPDVVGGAFRVPGGPSILTDGTFAWRLDLINYVREYSPQLPEEFVSHVTSEARSVPRLTREELIAITDEVCETLGFKES